MNRGCRRRALALGVGIALAGLVSTAEAAGAWRMRVRGVNATPPGDYPNGVDFLGPLLQAAWDTQTTAGNTSTPTNTVSGNTCSGIEGCNSVDANNVYLSGSGSYTNAGFSWGNRVVWVAGSGTFNFPNNKWQRSTPAALLLAIGESSGAPVVNITDGLIDYVNIGATFEAGVKCASGTLNITNTRLVTAGQGFITVNNCNATVAGSYFKGVGTASAPGAHIEFIHQHSGTGNLTVTGSFFDGRDTTIPASSWTGFKYSEPNTGAVAYDFTYNVFSDLPLQGGTTAGNYPVQVGTKPFISTGVFSNNALVSGVSGYFSRDSNAKLTAAGNVDLYTAAPVSILGGTGTAIPEVSVAPTQTGTAQVGQTGTCNPNVWTNSSGATYAYSWERSTDSGASYPNVVSSGQTRVYQAADATNGNYRVRCTVRVTNSEGIGQYWTTGQAIAP